MGDWRETCLYPPGLWNEKHWNEYLTAQQTNLSKNQLLEDCQRRTEILQNVETNFAKKKTLLENELDKFHEESQRYKKTQDDYKFMRDVEKKIVTMHWRVLMTEKQWQKLLEMDMERIHSWLEKKDGLKACTDIIEGWNARYEREYGKYNDLLKKMNEEMGPDSKEYKQKVIVFQWFPKIKQDIDNMSTQVSEFQFPSEDEEDEEDEGDIYNEAGPSMHQALSFRSPCGSSDESTEEREDKSDDEPEVTGAVVVPSAAESGSKPMEESEKSAKSAEPVASSSNSDSDDEDPAEKWNRIVRARKCLPPKEPELPPKEP